MRRAKKSKYRHVVIKNKKYYFYTIRWVDITGDAGHSTAEEFLKFKKIVNTFGPLLVMKRVMSYSQTVTYFQLGVLLNLKRLPFSDFKPLFL